MSKSRFKLDLWLSHFQDNDRFSEALCRCIQLVAKLLSIVLILVIFVSVFQLVQYFVLEFVGAVFFSSTDVNREGVKEFTKVVFTLFGLVLNTLIAIELLENLGGYLNRKVLQIELVISTALIAVARKIVILDLEKTAGLDLIALAATILAIAVAYWVVRRVNPQSKGTHLE
jgi:uncharacterized membrane protein (DUF373 family)